MAEKYRGFLPPDSIWFHLNREEARTLIENNPEIKALIPSDKTLAELNDADIQSLPGQTEDIEKLLQEAGIKIITLYD